MGAISRHGLGSHIHRAFSSRDTRTGLAMLFLPTQSHPPSDVDHLTMQGCCRLHQRKVALPNRAWNRDHYLEANTRELCTREWDYYSTTAWVDPRSIFA